MDKIYSKFLIWKGFNEIDIEITVFIFGLYIGITTLILINIFIAKLTSTFERVRTSSKSLFLLERAKEILIFENILCESSRIKILKNIPYKLIKNYKRELSEQIDDKDNIIQESARELNNKFDLLIKNNEENINNLNLKFQQQIIEIKNLFNEMNKKPSNFLVLKRDIIFISLKFVNNFILTFKKKSNLFILILESRVIIRSDSE